MAGKSSIEWTDATWNPTRGCSCISPGCKHCYAMKVAARFSGPGMAYEGLAFMHPKAGGQWTGELRLVEEQLDAPLRWSKPRRIFVNSMSDLFHEALTIEQIAEVFAVMYLSPRHTFQVLTKRAQRMREVLTDPTFYGLVLRAADRLRGERPKLMGVGISDPTKHPAPWVHLGVSVENQKAVEERAPDLVKTPAAVRFYSCEPLLENIDLPRFCSCGCGLTDRAAVREAMDGPAALNSDQAAANIKTTLGIDWVIVGGESGGDARRFDAGWARSIVEQCRAAGVPVFVKQMGANVVDRNDAGFHAEDETWAEGPNAGQPSEPGAWPSPKHVEDNINGFREDYQGAPVRVHLHDRAGGDMAEWPLELRVREFPGVTARVVVTEDTLP